MCCGEQTFSIISYSLSNIICKLNKNLMLTKTRINKLEKIIYDGVIKALWDFDVKSQLYSPTPSVRLY
jgi:hypothetical protein